MSYLELRKSGIRVGTRGPRAALGGWGREGIIGDAEADE
jgi:hypothetical protein